MAPPQTFYDCLALMLVLLWALMHSGGGGRLADPNSLFVRRAGRGAGGLALFCFVMVSAASDLHGGFPALMQYFAQLPARPPTWPLGVTFGMLGLLLCASFLSFSVGITGPRAPRNAMLAGSELIWLAAGAGLWLWGGLFVPASWDWGSYGRVWNFAVQSLCLFVIVDALVCIALSLRGAGRRRKGPTPYSMPRGKAGNASRKQAQDALRSDGGRKLPVDEEKF